MSISIFFIRFIAFAVIVYLLPFAAELFFSISIVSIYFELLFFFLFFLTSIVYLLSYFGIKKGGQNSVLSILGGLTLKMIFSLSLILVLILKDAENQKVLVGNFFYLYRSEERRVGKEGRCGWAPSHEEVRW